MTENMSVVQCDTYSVFTLVMSCLILSLHCQDSCQLCICQTLSRSVYAFSFLSLCLCMKSARLVDLLNVSKPVSPLKSDHPKKHIAYKRPISSSRDRRLKDQGRTHSKSEIKETKNVLISNHPRKIKRSNFAPRLKHKPGDTISNHEFPPMPVAWRKSNRSIWDDSAAHLLDMTMNFLKNIPKVKQIVRYM